MTRTHEKLSVCTQRVDLTPRSEFESLSGRGEESRSDLLVSGARGGEREGEEFRVGEFADRGGVFPHSCTHGEVTKLLISVNGVHRIAS